MLKQIFIQNFVFIEKAVIDLASGLNIISGETGAGKSIFLGALNATLGEKLSTDYIHPQKDSLQVITTFDITHHSKIQKILKTALEINTPNNLLHLKREITKEGKSRCFINDKLTNVKTLKHIASQLIDMHGQHENQHLFNAKYHIIFYDRFLHLEELNKSFTAQYKKYIDLQNTIKDFIDKKNQIEKERSFLLFTVKELKDGLITEEEYHVLANKLKNIESHGAMEHLFGKGETIIEQTLATIYDYQADVNRTQSDNAINDLSAKISTLLDTLENVKSHLNKHYTPAENNNMTVDELNGKLALAERLRKKYSRGLNDLQQILIETEGKLQFLEDVDMEMRDAVKQKDAQEQKVIELATELHHKRKTGRPIFEKKISEEVQFLGMKGAAVSIELSTYEGDEEPVEAENNNEKNKKKATLGSNGFDKAEFLYLPAPNATYKHLKNIASGGEISRIMLALKSLLHEKYDIPVLVFDEIDVGIGGATALNVGAKLHRLASTKQVLVITHLPQIAKYANKHFRILKKLEDNKTTTYIQTLSQKERIIEIARMLTGKEHDAEHIEMAKKFLNDKPST